MDYEIHAKDPDGSFHESPWTTLALPRIGELVELPDGSGGWQELIATEIAHYPNRIEVWVGGDLSGWEPGSVRALFDAAGRHHSTRALGAALFRT